MDGADQRCEALDSVSSRRALLLWGSARATADGTTLGADLGSSSIFTK